MSTLESLHSKVTTTHRAKLAYVYVRQSSLGQVTRHSESTELQYRLVERAIHLGWPRERISVIDEDLGKSGASTDQRLGFQHLIAEIGLARVGLVISLDASRLARNNRDWYQLLELCSIFGTLIADAEQVYDPRTYHDRLLLGLSGMMSEAELHQLRLRLHAGELQKAARGELRLGLPVGLERQRGGEVTLHPDEEIQARLRLVFEKFAELGSARGVMRYLRHADLPLPTRPVRGPALHDVIWQPASNSRVLSILSNPAYAGAYVYGRSTFDATHRKPGRLRSGQVRRPMEKWPVCLQNMYPAYITWEQYLTHQARLRDNQNRSEAGRHGVPRKGQALLQGIVLCGRCGARMGLHYSGPQGEYPVYGCNAGQHQYGSPRCQEVRARGLDAEIERLLLAALEPDKIALALSALAELEKETATLERQWQLRLERAKYEVERARRQYMAVEPENRMVARSLERQWEEKLRGVEEVEHAYQRWFTQQQLVITETDRQEILALGEDLPRVWRASTTTNADRKQLLRLMMRDVIVDNKRERGRVWFRINWQTGATSQYWLTRRVQSYADHPQLEQLQRRVRELNAAQKMDEQIAAILNEEGVRPSRGRAFSGGLVWMVRQQWQIPTVKENGKEANPLRWKDGTYSIEGVAEAVGVILGTVYQWVREGRVDGQQLGKGTPWKIKLTDEQLMSLREHVRRVRRIKRSKKEAS